MLEIRDIAAAKGSPGRLLPGLGDLGFVELVEDPRGHQQNMQMGVPAVGLAVSHLESPDCVLDSVAGITLLCLSTLVEVAPGQGATDSKLAQVVPFPVTNRQGQQ